MIDSPLCGLNSRRLRVAKKRSMKTELLGLSRGQSSTKIHLLIDGSDLPLAFRFTAEEPQALTLLEGALQRSSSGITATPRTPPSPASSRWVRPWSAVVQTLAGPTGSRQSALAKTCNRIESRFSHLNYLRRLATRYCRLRCCSRAPSHSPAHPSTPTMAIHARWLDCVTLVRRFDHTDQSRTTTRHERVGGGTVMRWGRSLLTST